MGSSVGWCVGVSVGARVVGELDGALVKLLQSPGAFSSSNVTSSSEVLNPVAQRFDSRSQPHWGMAMIFKQSAEQPTNRHGSDWGSGGPYQSSAVLTCVQHVVGHRSCTCDW